MKYEVVKTDINDRGFHELVLHLDADLYERYGDIMDDFNPLNRIDDLSEVVVIRQDDMTVACGALKPYNSDSVEIKRIFVRPDHRRRGLSRLLMCELEAAAKAAGYQSVLLETGEKLHEAVGLYKSFGYEIIDNYPPYVGMNYSVCMRKNLTDASCES